MQVPPQLIEIVKAHTQYDAIIASSLAVDSSDIEQEIHLLDVPEEETYATTRLMIRAACRGFPDMPVLVFAHSPSASQFVRSRFAGNKSSVLLPRHQLLLFSATATAQLVRRVQAFLRKDSLPILPSFAGTHDSHFRIAPALSNAPAKHDPPSSIGLEEATFRSLDCGAPPTIGLTESRVQDTSYGQAA